MSAADDEPAAPRTVTGWKAATVAIALIVGVFVTLNALARDDPDGGDQPRPSPSVVSAAPHERIPGVLVPSPGPT